MTIIDPHADVEERINRNVTRLARLILIAMLIQLAVIAYVFYSNYQGRQDLVNSQRRGCDRGKLDRGANAEGWRAAEIARIFSASKTLHISPDEILLMLNDKPLPGEIPDIEAARKYNRISNGLEERSRINCKKQFPDAEIFA